MNNFTGEYQALPEDMLSKRQVLFIQFMLWAGVKILWTSGAQTASVFVCNLHKTIRVFIFICTRFSVNVNVNKMKPQNAVGK